MIYSGFSQSFTLLPAYLQIVEPWRGDLVVCLISAQAEDRGLNPGSHLFHSVATCPKLRSNAMGVCECSLPLRGHISYAIQAFLLLRGGQCPIII